ncbi:MAG: hypothetical protein HQK92_13370 [Nitrospirae bacterium]|nr:hypothetical protein [Nitrospirota bacterium]
MKRLLAILASLVLTLSFAAFAVAEEPVSDAGAPAMEKPMKKAKKHKKHKKHKTHKHKHKHKHSTPS